jgi:hypothetical protein
MSTVAMVYFTALKKKEKEKENQKKKTTKNMVLLDGGIDLMKLGFFSFKSHLQSKVKFRLAYIPDGFLGKLQQQQQKMLVFSLH